MYEPIVVVQEQNYRCLKCYNIVRIRETLSNTSVNYLEQPQFHAPDCPNKPTNVKSRWKQY